MTNAPNPYEQQARARKVDKLAAWIVAAMANMRDLSPVESYDAAVRFCDNANAGAWEMAARECGVNVPSAETVAVLRARLVAMRDEMARHPDDVFAGFPS